MRAMNVHESDYLDGTRQKYLNELIIVKKNL